MSNSDAEEPCHSEMKHGPIALIDENMPVIVLAPRDGTYHAAVRLGRDVDQPRNLAQSVTVE